MGRAKTPKETGPASWAPDWIGRKKLLMALCMNAGMSRAEAAKAVQKVLAEYRRCARRIIATGTPPNT